MAPPAMIQMLTPLPVAFAGAVVVAAALSLLRNSGRYDQLTRGLLLIGAALFALAAGTPVWLRADANRVTAMVDLSPSTRGADYRRRTFLKTKIAQLLGDTPVDVLAFSSSNVPLPPQENLPDLPCDRTVFSPPPGQPVLLFSDGQFELPAVSPQVYAVLDPQLMQPDDSRVASLQLDGRIATATIEHRGPPRQATWSGTKSDATITISGSTNASIDAGTDSVQLSLNAADRWPENDALSAVSPPTEVRSRWWIGPRDPGAGWTHLQPSQCPIDQAAWLEPAVVVLDNVPANALERLQQDALLRYVRDLGGSVVILGGDHAFAAGAYGSTPLGTISALADAPPTPQARWIVLIDASGSMAAAGPTGSLFDSECAAARTLLPLLPPADPVAIGSFSRNTHWWINSTVADALHQPLPPPGVGPSGPTVLEPALRAAAWPGSVPTHLLLMTDADTDPIDAKALTSVLSTASARLLVLALGHGRALPSLRELATATHGDVVEQPDATRWAQSASDLLKTQLPDRLETSAIQFTFTGDFHSLGTGQADHWNRTWLKHDAELLATAGDSPIAARWHVGTGVAVAVAYGMTPADANAIADLVAAAPGDPRFTVRWDVSSASPQVSVTAVDHNYFMNQQSLRLLSVDGQSPAPPEDFLIPQVAPGKYELSLPPLPRTRLVRVMHGAQQLDRRAIAGRYPIEFDHIGTDRRKLQQLAERTGGAVVPVGQVTPLKLSGRRVQWSLAEPLIGIGACVIARALWRWKRGHGRSSI